MYLQFYTNNTRFAICQPRNRLSNVNSWFSSNDEADETEPTLAFEMKVMKHIVKVESKIKLPGPIVFCLVWQCCLVQHVQRTSDFLVGTHDHSRLAASSKRRKEENIFTHMHAWMHTHAQVPAYTPHATIYIQWCTVSGGSFPNI